MLKRKVIQIISKYIIYVRLSFNIGYVILLYYNFKINCLILEFQVKSVQPNFYF